MRSEDASGLKVTPVHTRVPGRARVRIEGLRGSPALGEVLHKAFKGDRRVGLVSANPVTGTALFLYDPARALSELLDRLETLLSPKRGGSRAGSPPVDPPVRLEGRPLLAGVRERVRALFPHGEEQRDRPWHLLDAEGLLSGLKTERTLGLSMERVQERLGRYGPNVLPEAQPRSRWDVLAGQFLSLPVGLLAGAAAVSVLTGGLLDATVILGVVLANGIIGFLTESAAERTIQSLKGFLRPTATVLREGAVREVPARELVAGDLCLLKPGSYVPADCRILEASHLTVDESALTGESLPVAKTSRTLKRERVPLPDRTNMVFMGTLVTGGEGVALVVVTGRFTQMGRLQALLQETSSPGTPMGRQLQETGNHLVLLCGGVCGIVFGIGVVRGYGLVQMLKVGISLAASAVPEGLPASATMNFALGIQRMKEKGVLIRRLPAVETLGSVQTVCMDKTGTITWNRMKVLALHAGDRRVLCRNGTPMLEGAPVSLVEHEDFRLLLRTAVLCNETRMGGLDGKGEIRLEGSPTETALFRFALSSGMEVASLLEGHRLLKVNYRAENRLFMGTLHGAPQALRVLSMKGSPLEVLARCAFQMRDGRRVPLTTEDREAIERENSAMAGEALRVLGFAFLETRGQDPGETEEGLTWLGLMGMADPVRQGVRELIEVFHRAGIRTVMITGDQSATAYAVAREIDISGGGQIEILDSTALDAMSPPLLEALARKADVYARVSPAHKLQIVQALQRTGMVVAMTGDGINDSPALKAADIGIAMGKGGTDLAREVADVVLEDDDLACLVSALREGRVTHSNIRKSVHFFLSTNFTEIMVTLASMALGAGIPLNVMQLLWINVVSDILPGLALSLEEADPEILNQPPREPGSPLFSMAEYKGMAKEAAVMSACALGAYAYGLFRYGAGAKAGTLAFETLTIAQLLHALSCRSERRSFLDREGMPPNPMLTLAVGGSLVLQGLTLVIPGLRNLLGMAPLGPLDLLVVGGGAILSFLSNEMTKKGGLDRT